MDRTSLGWIADVYFLGIIYPFFDESCTASFLNDVCHTMANRPFSTTATYTQHSTLVPSLSVCLLSHHSHLPFRRLRRSYPSPQHCSFPFILKGDSFPDSFLPRVVHSQTRSFPDPFLPRVVSSFRSAPSHPIIQTCSFPAIRSHSCGFLSHRHQSCSFPLQRPKPSLPNVVSRIAPSQ